MRDTLVFRASLTFKNVVSPREPPSLEKGERIWYIPRANDLMLRTFKLTSSRQKMMQRYVAYHIRLRDRRFFQKKLRIMNVRFLHLDLIDTSGTFTVQQETVPVSTADLLQLQLKWKNTAGNSSVHCVLVIPGNKSTMHILDPNGQKDTGSPGHSIQQCLTTYLTKCLKAHHRKDMVVDVVDTGNWNFSIKEKHKDMALQHRTSASIDQYDTRTHQCSMICMMFLHHFTYPTLPGTTVWDDGSFATREYFLALRSAILMNPTSTTSWDPFTISEQYVLLQYFVALMYFMDPSSFGEVDTFKPLKLTFGATRKITALHTVTRNESTKTPAAQDSVQPRRSRRLKDADPIAKKLFSNVSDASVTPVTPEILNEIEVFQNTPSADALREEIDEMVHGTPSTTPFIDIVTPERARTVLTDLTETQLRALNAHSLVDFVTIPRQELIRPPSPPA